MGTGTIILLIVIALVLIIGIGFIVSYNRFVKQRNLVTESWRQIDVELKRRHDLIPNLIETVKAFASHERQVFESVTQARSMAEQVRTQPGIHADQQAAAEQQLSGSLSRLIAVAENYPTLRSNENFLGLQRELTDTEDRIAAGRRFYNGNVRALNTRIEAFPSNFIAGIFKFTKEQYFELDDPAARNAVKADFSSLTGTAPEAPGTYQQQSAPQAQYGGQPPQVQNQPQVDQQFGQPQQQPQFGQQQPPAPQQGQQPHGQPPTQ